MWVIVAHHYVVHNVDFPTAYSTDLLDHLVLDVYFRNAGRIASGLFLMVSIWYLCQSCSNLVSSCRRIWLLERELLAYGIVLYCCHFAWTRDTVSLRGIVKTLMPLLTGQWWYVSCYALLLLMIPFLFVGLRSLHKRQHTQLLVISVIIFGLLRFVPESSLSTLVGFSLFIDFVVITVVVTYVRWHITLDTLKAYRWWVLLLGVVGLAMMPIIAYMSSLQMRIISPLAANFMNAYYTSPAFALSLVIEIAALVYAVTAKERYNVWINRAAASTLGVYLISDVESVRELLWQRIFPFSQFEIGHSGILSAIVAVTVVYVICSIIDELRIALFAMTIDRRRGYWFERLCNVVGITRQSV